MSTTVLEFSNENGLLNQILTGYCQVMAHAKQNPKETATTKHALSGQKRENKGKVWSYNLWCPTPFPSLFTYCHNVYVYTHHSRTYTVHSEIIFLFFYFSFI
jgi:hypothetical protein